MNRIPLPKDVTDTEAQAIYGMIMQLASEGLPIEIRKDAKTNLNYGEFEVYQVRVWKAGQELSIATGHYLVDALGSAYRQVPEKELNQ